MFELSIHTKYFAQNLMAYRRTVNCKHAMAQLLDATKREANKMLAKNCFHKIYIFVITPGRIISSCSVALTSKLRASAILLCREIRKNDVESASNGITITLRTPTALRSR